MKLKTTLNKTDCKFIFPNLLQSLTCKALGDHNYSAKKNSLLIIGCLFLFAFSSYGQANNCTAKIIVENNGNVDSASPDGVLYNLILTNTGTSLDRYILSSVNVNSNSKNPDESKTNTNVVLKTVFLDTKKNEITELTVNSGESISFFSKLTVPIGTPLAKWSSNKIIATSTNCDSYKVDTILHTYVLNPNID